MNYLEYSLIIAKKIAVASGFDNYNIRLQARGHPHLLRYISLICLSLSE